MGKKKNDDASGSESPKKGKGSKKGKGGTGKAKKEKKEKDPNAPKRAVSAYLYYASERRPELKKEQPDLGFGELTKTIADEWKALSEKDKKKFNDLAAKDKKRYEEEKANYVPSK